MIHEIDTPFARVIKKKKRRNKLRKLAMNRRNHNKQHRNTKAYKRLQLATVCQIN